MNHRFLFRRNRFPPDHLDQAEHQPAPVQSGDRQQVHQAQVDGDQHQQLCEGAEPAFLHFARYDAHDPDRPGCLIQSFSRRHQVLQRPEDRAGRVHAQLPAVPESVEEGYRLLLRPVGPADRHADPHLFLGFVPYRAHFHVQGFVSPFHGHLQRLIPCLPVLEGVQQRIHRAVQHILPVDLRHTVPGLHAGGIRRSGRHDLGDVRIDPRRDADPAHPVEDCCHQKGQHEVHHRAHQDHEQPLPYVLLRKRAGIVLALPGRVVLPVEGAVSADRNRPHREGCLILPALPADQLRPHPDGEFPDLDLHRPCRQEMPEFVNRDQDRQQQDRQQYIHLSLPLSLSGRPPRYPRCSLPAGRPVSPAHAPPAARSPRRGSRSAGRPPRPPRSLR